MSQNDSDEHHITANRVTLAHDSLSDSGTNTSDEFDWEAEDDNFPTTDLATAKTTRRGRRLYDLFMKLARPIRTFVVAVLGGAILVTPYIITDFLFDSNPARPHVIAWSLWLAISWAIACGLFLIVDLLPRIIIALVTLFRGRVERLKTQLELVYAVSGWLKLVLVISDLWIVLSATHTALNPPGPYWGVLNRVMQALFSATIILLVEKLFLRFVAIRFHEKALAERLAENRLALKALDCLSNSQPLMSKRTTYDGHKRKNRKPIFTRSRSASVDILSSELDTRPYQGHAKNAVKQPSSEGKKPQKALTGLIIDQVGDALGQVAFKDSKFNREGEITGLHSARRLAKQLFSMLSNVQPPRNFLIVEDFYPFFHSTTDATVAFALFDKDRNGNITKKEMREAVQRIYRERKALVASLKDVGNIVAKLDAVLTGVALLVILFCCLLIFNKSNTIASLVPLATIILGFSFVFGNSAQTLFESLIFIFSTHVFDVGDLVLIDDQPMYVREFGLFSTTFRRVDGQEVIAPNSLLASAKLVYNLRRSSSTWESTTITVSYDTPLQVIDSLQSRLRNYVVENNREWSNVAVNIDKMEFQNAISLVIAMEHRANWQDWGGRWARRTQFMRTLKTILEELDVTYSLPVQPVLLPKPADHTEGTLLNVPTRFSSSIARSPSCTSHGSMRM